MLLAATVVLRAQSADEQVLTAAKRAANYLATHHQSPEDYVISKFQEHDIVFLGEPHLVRQPLQFLQKLIPRLYKAGIYNLGYEMSLSEDQAEIDRILQASSYDNEKALELVFRWDAQLGWAFQEYADVYRAAWQLNQSLPKGAPRFRVIAIDLRPDWSLVKPGDAILSRPTRWKAWWGSNQIARNVWMNQIIRREFIDRGLKAAIYNGSGHTHLTVERDAREETGLRFSVAYQVRKKIGARVTAIELLSSRNQNAAIAPIIAALPARYQIIGFDLNNGAVGDVPLPEKIATTIVVDPPAAHMADYYLEGAAQLSLQPEPTTPVPGFITEARVAEAKRAGWLPNVPEINLEWILSQQRKFLSSFEAHR